MRRSATPDIAIIGNGIAGNSAVSAIRASDPNARITLISEEECPLYSPCAFYKYLSGEIDRKRLLLKTIDSYAKEGVTTRFGQKVSQIDPKVREVMVGDTAIRFDRLVLATGSRPIFPPIRGSERPGVFALKTMADVQSIARHPASRVVVVGSGPIGIESAIGLRKKGLEVTVVEILDRILPRLFDEKPSSMCRKILEEHGIHVRTEERVLEIMGEERTTGVATDKSEIPCEMVIMGAGVCPNTELALTMGVSVGGLGGIRTDDTMLTCIDGVYACGDCVESRDIVTRETTLNLLWMNAKRQGFVAGRNCLGDKRRFEGSYSTTVMEMFGSYATSAGKILAGRENGHLEAIEGESGGGYYRLVVSGNRLVGIQLIDKSEKAGMLFSKMLRRDDVVDLIRSAQDDRWISMRPWNFWIRKYKPSAVLPE